MAAAQSFGSGMRLALVELLARAVGRRARSLNGRAVVVMCGSAYKTAYASRREAFGGEKIGHYFRIELSQRRAGSNNLRPPTLLEIKQTRY